LIIFLAFPILANATDCATLKDREVVRLDVKGRSLENLKPQDQDGLGICYANATSLVLQSIIPNHPDVSYLNIAIHEATSKLNINKSLLSPNTPVDIYTKKTNSTTSPPFDAGSSCASIRTLVDRQKAYGKPILCPRDSINLENMASSPEFSWEQFENILNASTYMNEFQTTFKLNSEESKKQYHAFRNSLAKVIIEQKNYFKKNGCNKITPIGNNPFFNLFVQLLRIEPTCLKVRDLSSPVCRTILSIFDTGQILSNGAIKIETFNSDLLKILNLKTFENLKNKSPSSFRDNLLFSVKLVASLNEEESKVIANAIDQIPKDVMEKQSDQINEIKINGFSNLCAEQETLKYLQSEKFKDYWKSEMPNCTNPKLMESLANLVGKYPLKEIGKFDNVTEFILKNAGLNFNMAMKTLFAADCDDKNKILIPENLTCKQEQYVPDKDKVATNSIISGNLKNDIPVVGIICGNIYKDPAIADRNNCENHLVTIIGMKCVDGKNNYLIQNSWGKNFIPPNNVLIPEPGNGSAWFDEKSLNDSLLSFEVFNK